MKNIFIFLLLISFANSANLLTHNVYERTDRVDVMLSFDSPYEGKISQKKGANITTLNLSDLTYDRLIEKNINSNILQAITIQPNKDSLNVILKSDNAIAVIASKTVDGFGLRIRTKPMMKKSQKQVVKTPVAQTETPISTKPSEDLIDERYIAVILLLSLMILFMFWVKKRVANKTNQVKTKNSWLFKDEGKNLPSGEVNVLHKKQIDNTNSVVLLEFENRKYLVMTGSSNVLLEKFSKDDIKDDSDFEKAFEDNRKKLDEYLKIQKQEEMQNDYRSKLERY
jgi:hypothetical protein